MSDCNTQAMKPKEPQTLSSCCPYCSNPTPHANAIRNRQHSIDEAINDALKEKQSLEQRCQQLEQVAKELYKAISPMHEQCCEDTCRTLGDMGWGADYCLQEFREQLEALGVSLDD